MTCVESTVVRCDIDSPFSIKGGSVEGSSGG